MSIDPISAKKALETLSGIEDLESEDAEASRESLDEQELREVEAKSVGLPTEADQPPAGLAARIRRWFSRG